MLIPLKCAVCDFSAMAQGALIQEEGKADEPKIVCGLHLTPTGDEVKKTEVAGSWEVLQSWGFESVDTRVVDLWDKGMERFDQAGADGAGWKVVATVGDVSLEVSCVPRGNGYGRGPGPVKQPTSSSAELTNESINQGINWQHKVSGSNVPAGPDAAWAWGWMQAQDGSQSEIQIALAAAIGPADKAEHVIGDTTYTIGGREKNLFNRKKKEVKK